ncbi:NTP transferase domain-containing protein [Candidatus Uhrbacteria bacterium]|jgi:bifunctional UDP-N-acetylglucosamine pyrophosphorylase / glucosamine-1-phosphate N-acetyltransferase|nr:NTP transferase domain-containing protein [Candidatus Uhrbacteria bacterium]MBT7717490.1 NTP transferase domain-containing protein [Candidatus Uhrbacteria bacterium]
MRTRVIVLAAGKGKRMGREIPKPLVEIAGRPMVEHLIDSIIDSELDSRPILVIAPDNIELFQDALGDKCEYVTQQDQLGTGDAVRAAEDAFSDSDCVMVFYGDHPFLTAEKMQELKDLYEQERTVLSMVTTKVPSFKGQYEGLARWGRIIRGEVGTVTAIREAKDASEAELEIKEVNPALFAFDAQWLKDHLPMLSNKNASGEYYLTDLIEMAIEEGEEISTITAEPLEVIGINTEEELEKAQELIG